MGKVEEKGWQRPAAARAALGAIWALGLATAMACNSGVGPTAGCVNNEQCGNGKLCKAGVCVSPNEFACKTDNECVDARTANSWKTDPLTACQAAKCVESICKVVNVAEKTDCEDGDGKPCTIGACDAAGKCTPAAKITAGFCWIDANCRAKGDRADKDADAKPDLYYCLSCQPELLQTNWSPTPAGTACKDDKLPCTADVCEGKEGKCTHELSKGNCLFDGKTCAAANDKNPAKECEACLPDQSTSAYKPLPATATCGDDGVACTQDLCDGKGGCVHGALVANFCRIGSDCIAASTPNPKNPCETCNPALATDKYSPASAGTACESDKLACTDETCDGKGTCGDAKVKAGTCLVSGACYADKQPIDPAKPCVVCDAANSKIGPTNLPENAACEAGAPCLAGSCKAGVCINNGPKPKTCYVAADKACADENALNPKNSCLSCQPDVSPTEWKPLKKGAACLADATNCTIDVCDGAGNCQNLPSDATCAGNNSACTVGVCDKVLDCLKLPKDVTVVCDGADGIACTVETCDGKGSCGATGKMTDALCDDKLDCTFDSCQATGCIHGPMNDKCSDGNECTSDKCDVQKGCINDNLADGTACADDGLKCTDNHCEAGACKAVVAINLCVIDNKCIDGGAKIDGGCKFCLPGPEDKEKLIGGTYKWTVFGPGVACDSDNVACTADQCDKTGVCAHVADATQCTDGLPCQAADCDVAKGCLYTDNCPWGHYCDSTDKVCLTTGKLPLELVKSDADNPNPTNPAVAVHDLVSGGQKLWVAWQSDSAQAVENGGWVIKNPAGVRLRMLGLAPQKAAPDKKVKPEVVTLPTAGLFGGSKTVVQAFAVVAKDPQEPKQTWLAWLEADPAQTDAAKACLVAGGQGGVLRVARVDGNTANGKVDVAGEVCTQADGIGPLFLTQGFAVLDGSGAEIGDVSKRQLLTVRAVGTKLGDWATNFMLKGKPAGVANPVASLGSLAPFAKVHPVLVDLGGKAAAAERFLAVGATSDAGAFGLWANYVKADGSKGAAASWAAADPVAKLFGGFKDVCSVDAAVAPSGELGVVVVARGGGNDLVELVTRDGGGVVKVVEVSNLGSDGGQVDCRYGISGARVQYVGEWIVSQFVADSAVISGKAHHLRNASGKFAPFAPWPDIAGTTDSVVAGATPTSSLSWRGLGGLAGFGGALAIADEFWSAKLAVRAIQLRTTKL